METADTRNESTEKVEMRKCLDCGTVVNNDKDTCTHCGSEVLAVLHYLHCPLDGTKLHEIALGLVACSKCDTQFIPTTDLEWEKDHPTSVMHNLCWVEDKKMSAREMQTRKGFLFDRCVRRERVGSGKIRYACRLGLWSVEGYDENCVDKEARRYWYQYYSDGEYESLLSSARSERSVEDIEKAMSSRERERLVEAVKEAYCKRGDAFPDLTEANRKWKEAVRKLREYDEKGSEQ